MRRSDSKSITQLVLYQCWVNLVDILFSHALGESSAKEAPSSHSGLDLLERGLRLAGYGVTELRRMILRSLSYRQ